MLGSQLTDSRRTTLAYENGQYGSFAHAVVVILKAVLASKWPLLFQAIMAHRAGFTRLICTHTVESTKLDERTFITKFDAKNKPDWQRVPPYPGPGVSLLGMSCQLSNSLTDRLTSWRHWSDPMVTIMAAAISCPRLSSRLVGNTYRLPGDDPDSFLS